MQTFSQSDQVVADTILRLVTERGAAKSICPTEAARALDDGATPDGWRSHLSEVRRVARTLAQAGRIDILRKGRPIAVEEIRGVIRLRLKPSDQQSSDQPDEH